MKSSYRQVNKLQKSTSPKFVYRIARGEPWVIRPPRGHNRFDIFDPDEPIMTLYTGESEEAAWAEVLAPFRPDLETIAAINNIPCDDNRTPSSGKVPQHWLDQRKLGKAKIKPKASIIDITQFVTIQALRNESDLAAQAIKSGFNDLDDSALKASDQKGRLLTQKIAAYIYNQGNDGIRYESRLGSEYKCIAGFVALNLDTVAASNFIDEIFASINISAKDRALRKIALLMKLRLPYVII